jgi:transposase
VARAPPLRQEGTSQRRFIGGDQVGVDETNYRRGHDYVSVFVDLDRAPVVFATPTREKVLGEFKNRARSPRRRGRRVTNFSADPWQPYREGIKRTFPTPSSPSTATTCSSS